MTVVKWSSPEGLLLEATEVEARVVKALEAGEAARWLQENGGPLRDICRLWRRSYHALEEALGPEDPETLTAAAHLAACLEARGEAHQREAVAVYQRMLDWRRQLKSEQQQQPPPPFREQRTESSGSLAAFVARAEEACGAKSEPPPQGAGERIFTVLTNPKVRCERFAEQRGGPGLAPTPLPTSIEGFCPLPLARLHRGPWRPLCD